MSPDDPWQGATMFTCDAEPEEITAEDPWQALRDHLDNVIHWYGEKEGETRKEHFARCLSLEAPNGITVYGYRPCKIRETPDFSDKIDYLMENIGDDWHDDYGGPDREGNEPDLTTHEKKIITVVLDAAWSRTTSWRCDKVSERTYTVEDLLEIFPEGET